MPPLQTVNAQSRRKSCSECVKAKRKCDIGQLRCTRCSRQNLTCTYPSHSNLQSTLSGAENLGSYDEPLLPSAAIPDVVDAGDTTYPFDLEALNIPTTIGSQLLDLDVSTAITSLTSLSHFTDGSTDGADQMATQRFYWSVTPSTFSSANIAPLAMSRIGYAIDQLKLAPRTMVQSNSTPWSHAMVYDEHMPRSLQNAYAACALYIARNDLNAGFVARHITSCVDDLIATPLPTAPIEVLARAHALMLYQVMLVFGGDIRLYSRGEALVPHLEEISNLLLGLNAQQIDPSGSLPLYPSAAARAAWTNFVFRETLRRTVLSLFQFVALCYLLHGQLSPCSHEGLQGNKVTLSALLWSVKSALDFAVVWNEKKRFLVHELDFTEVLRDAQPDDIDTFAKMMLVGLQGIDDIKGWFYTRGAVL